LGNDWKIAEYYFWVNDYYSEGTHEVQYRLVYRNHWRNFR